MRYRLGNEAAIRGDGEGGRGRYLEIFQWGQGPAWRERAAQAKFGRRVPDGEVEATSSCSTYSSLE